MDTVEDARTSSGEVVLDNFAAVSSAASGFSLCYDIVDSLEPSKDKHVDATLINGERTLEVLSHVGVATWTILQLSYQSAPMHEDAVQSAKSFYCLLVESAR